MMKSTTSTGVYLMPRLFPTPHHPNIVISSTGVADRKGYSALVTNRVPNLHLTDTGQCFPMYWYEKVGEADDEQEPQDELFASTMVAPGEADSYGYLRHDSITDWALDVFRQTYADDQIGKDDIFWYVYGLMHSPEYRQRFAIDLKKSIPRIPLAQDFWSFSKVGRQLGHWHLNYETVEAYPLEEEASRLVMEAGDFKVGKMSFGKKDGKADQSVIVYNGQLALRGVPLKAYDYVVAGKSAVEWIMEMYQIRVDPDSKIRNDPNDWSANARYIVDLLKKVVRVSIESAQLIESLPDLEERSPSPNPFVWRVRESDETPAHPVVTSSNQAGAA